MPTAGPNSAGAGASQAGVGTVTWTSPGSVTVSDNTRATVTLSGGAQSQYLVASSFGFAIPAGATIDGIVVEVEKSSSSASNVLDNRVRIVKGGAIGATDKSSATPWVITSSEAYVTYGGAADLWGETWTANDINASTFGATISVRNSNVKQLRSAYVDHIRITVYYTEATTTTTTTTTPAPTRPFNQSRIGLGIRL